ncbi:MAG: peptide ABC transporter substrate-binding protein [Gammaproteobacteria bacterium]|nr:MAG: peptide ABC transporter substrate-binding protein [Gammaproteobacteria bacterium]
MLTSQPIAWLFATLLFLSLTACDERPWNNPYPKTASNQNILYSSFEERPKHLDPVRSYSSNEYSIIANIYEPPLQYHYLKRPYTLTTQTAKRVPVPYYLDGNSQRLPDNTPIDEIAWSIYDIEIQPGIQYQPHPALARDEQGNYRYHNLTANDLEDIYTLSDFKYTGTRELTAEDYVYQIKRMAHPSTNSPIYGVMEEYIDGLGEYAKQLKEAFRQQQAQQSSPVWLDLRQFELAGVKATGRYTYQVRIKGKYPQFKYWLAMPFFAPMPWEADRFHTQPGMKDKNLTLHWYPIGTGPYMLTVNNPNLRMVMERNPNFHGETYPAEGMPGDAEEGLLADAGKQIPFIDMVVESLEKESIPRWNKFLQGYYDVSGISSDTFDQAVDIGGAGEVTLTSEMQDKGIRLATAVATTTYYFGFNMLDPIVGTEAGERGKYLRQAIAIAVDYEEFISIFMNGRGIAAQGPIPPGIYGFREGQDSFNPYVYTKHNDTYKRRPIEDAKMLLRKAGYPDGRDAKTGQQLKLYYDVTASGPDSKAQLSWWRKQFTKLGIELIVRPTDWNRFQDKMLKGTAQLFSMGWNADYPDPENFLFLLYGPNGKTQYHGENGANYSNPEFNQLFEKMKNMENSEERQSIIDRMVEIVREDSPWLWGLHPKSFALYHEWYFNSKPNLMANNTLKYKRIDPVIRDKNRSEWNRPVTWPIWLIVIALVISALPAFLSYRRRQRAMPSRHDVFESKASHEISGTKGDLP